jgi:hypothetical protein
MEFNTIDSISRHRATGDPMNYGDRPLNIPPEEDATPATERSIRAITEVGLPPLRGMAADIAAAHEIRLAKLIAADDLLTQLRNDEQETELGHMAGAQPSAPVSRQEVQEAQAALNRLRHQDDAAWWLAQNDRSVQELLALFRADRQPPQ